MKCSKCFLEFEGDDIDNHNLTCSYAFSNTDFENLIPCEFCNELISFEDYERHMSFCSRSIYSQQLPVLNFRNFPLLNTQENNEENENLNQNINNINNDPIARSLFNMFIGGLPPSNLSESNNEINNNQPIVNSNNPESLTNSLEFTFLNLPNNLNQNANPENIETNSDDRMDIDEDSDDDYPNENENENQLQENQNNENINLPPSQPSLENINNILTIFEDLLNNPNHNINFQNINPNINPNQPNIFSNIFANEEEDNYEELINLPDHEVGISNIDEISEMLFEEIDCPICSETKLISRKTNCGHAFCDDCLKEWLKTNKKCPICMIELE
jgi:hypothetical protein